MNLLLHRPDAHRTLPEGRAPRLLALQIAGIGDLVLATPALDALRERFPDARIDLLTSPRAVELLQHHPALDHIYGFDIARFRNPATLLNPLALHTLWRSIRPMRENHYDALLSLNNISTGRGAWTLGCLMKFIGSPLWVGRNTDGRAPWFDLALPDPSSAPVPEALTKVRVVELLSASGESRPLSLPIDPASEKRAQILLGEDGKPWAALLPGANVEDKRWPADRFAIVARSLVERGFRIISLGGPEDAPVVDVVANGLGDAMLRLEGKLTLPETAAVLARCTIAVSNDTGPMHMAAAVGTPLIALFCSVNTVRYRPWAHESEVRLLTSEPAEVDPATSAGRRASILGIQVDEVLAEINALLDQMTT